MQDKDKRRRDTTDKDEQYDQFVTLLARNEQAIRRFVRFLLPNGEGVDDVMQDVALECWKKFSTFDPTDQTEANAEFVRWANVISRFKVLSWQRDQARDRLVFRESVIEQLYLTSEAENDRLDEQRLAITKCLQELPADHQRLVLSVHTHGESIQRIAKETGASARRLYSKLNHLRSLLLECVQRRAAKECDVG